VCKIAEHLYTEANRGAKPKSIKIEEMSVTGNQSLKSMNASKLRWLTVDDDEIPAIREDENSTCQVLLQQQRIRVFEVTFPTEAPQFLFKI